MSWTEGGTVAHLSMYDIRYINPRIGSNRRSSFNHNLLSSSGDNFGGRGRVWSQGSDVELSK